jgi:hypothetical protein
MEIVLVGRFIIVVKRWLINKSFQTVPLPTAAIFAED